MKVLATLIIAAALSGCATLREEPLEMAWQVAHAADVAMTIKTMKLSCAREGHFITRRLIGEKPSDKEILAWGVGGAVFHVAVSDYLRRKDWIVVHDIWQVVSLTDTGIAIGKNIKVQKRGC